MASSPSSSSQSNNPASIISSLFKTDFDSSFATTRYSPNSSSSSSTTATKSSALNPNHHTSTYARKRRKSVHEEYRNAVNEGKLHLIQMENADTFVKWVMDDDNKKVAIYCSVCEKFLGPNKGGSYFTHIRTCKNTLYPGLLPPAPLNEQQKDDFSYTVVEAVGKDLNLFNQINSDAFKQCIQKALELGFEAKTYGYGPPDATELLCNPRMESYMSSSDFNHDSLSSAVTTTSFQFKTQLFNEIQQQQSESTSPLITSLKEELIYGGGNETTIKLIPLSTLGEEIFEANEYTDVTLTTSDGKEIKAHRCFLSHASPIFKQIFDKKTRNASKIDLDFTEDVTNRALKFCYGNYNSVAGCESALLEFANKYEIQQLKERCLSHLEDTVNATNVCDIIRIAYDNNYEALKQKCIQTLVNNKGIIGKESVNNLPQPILCDILFAQ